MDPRGDVRLGGGTGEGNDLGSGGQASGCDTASSRGRRWPLQDLHTAEDAELAVGTEAQPVGQEIENDFVASTALGLWLSGDLGLSEGVTAAVEESDAAGVGEEAVVTDTDEAARKDVEQEAAGELFKREGEGSRPPAPVVLEAEGDARVVDVEQAVVRDRDAVGVAGEVLEDLAWSAEGWFGVDDPLGVLEFLEPAVPGGALGQAGERAARSELALAVGGAEQAEQGTAEVLAEDGDGQEEVRPRGDPSCLVGAQLRPPPGTTQWTCG